MWRANLGNFSAGRIPEGISLSSIQGESLGSREFGCARSLQRSKSEILRNQL